MNNDSVFEKHAIRRYRRGERSMWVVCSMAERVVRDGDPERIHRLARNMSRSPDTVKWWAGAYVTFLSLSKFLSSSQARVPSEEYPTLIHLRRELSVKHFALLGRAWQRYEFDPPTAVYLLTDAAENRTSANEMNRVIKDIYDEGQREDEWVDHFLELRDKADAYKNDFMVPAILQDAARDFVKSVDKYFEEHGT